MCLALICASGRWWALLLLRMLRTQHSDRCAMSAQAHSEAGASKELKKAGHRHRNPICFRIDAFHANVLVAYASDRITTKQALREAGGVRRDVRSQRLYQNFTLGQRVKLRLAEPADVPL